MAQPTVAETLAERVAAMRSAMLPDPVRRMAEDLVLDVAGLCLAARHTDYVKAVIASAMGAGGATAIGHERGFDCATAALINGTAAHGEDFDDTFEGGPVHAEIGRASCRERV